ncbi:hypothetical protein EJB05_26764, partial [Eragrostis curvula]
LDSLDVEKKKYEDIITIIDCSKYLDCIVEETKEEKALRMKRQQTQRQKEYEMIRKGIIPPDSIHLTANIMYRVVANICHFISKRDHSSYG